MQGYSSITKVGKIISRDMRLQIVTSFTDHLQVVTTNNCNTITISTLHRAHSLAFSVCYCMFPRNGYNGYSSACGSNPLFTDSRTKLNWNLNQLNSKPTGYSISARTTQKALFFHCCLCICCERYLATTTVNRNCNSKHFIGRRYTRRIEVWEKI
jgi:hypothetical protein